MGLALGNIISSPLGMTFIGLAQLLISVCSGQNTQLFRPWDSPGKNTGVGCHFLLQCMKVKSESEVAQSCPTLLDPMDCSLPASSVHGIFQARVLQWGTIAFSYSCSQVPPERKDLMSLSKNYPRQQEAYSAWAAAAVCSTICQQNCPLLSRQGGPRSSEATAQQPQPLATTFAWTGWPVSCLDPGKMHLLLSSCPHVFLPHPYQI